MKFSQEIQGCSGLSRQHKSDTQLPLQVEEIATTTCTRWKDHDVLHVFQI